MTTLDLESAATLLGISPSTLQARAKAGIIPGCKIGRAWRFIEVDLLTYMREQYPANKPQGWNHIPVEPDDLCPKT